MGKKVVFWGDILKICKFGFFFFHLILSSGMRLCNCPGLPGQGEETLQ